MVDPYLCSSARRLLPGPTGEVSWKCCLLEADLTRVLTYASVGGGTVCPLDLESHGPVFRCNLSQSTWRSLTLAVDRQEGA